MFDPKQNHSVYKLENKRNFKTLGTTQMAELSNISIFEQNRRKEREQHLHLKKKVNWSLCNLTLEKL